MTLTTLIRNGWLLAFTALVFLAGVLLPEVMSWDSSNIASLMEDPDVVGGQMEGSFIATARFFSLFPPPLDTLLILSVGWSVLWLYMRNLLTPQAALLACYLTLPALVASMVRPQKETIVLILAIASMLVATNPKLTISLKVLGIMVMYAAYAAIFRNYYFVIIAIFAGLYLFETLPRARIFLILAGLAVLLLTPVEIFDTLQGVRDRVNYIRVGSGELGHRTVFLNPFPADNLLHFLANYAYATVRLNVPILFDLNIKAWYWMSVVTAYAATAVYGYRKATGSQTLLLHLFMAHALVLQLFEPDTGTYSRHITSVFLYTIPGLLALDTYFNTPRQADFQATKPAGNNKA